MFQILLTIITIGFVYSQSLQASDVLLPHTCERVYQGLDTPVLNPPKAKPVVEPTPNRELPPNPITEWAKGIAEWWKNPRPDLENPRHPLLNWGARARRLFLAPSNKEMETDDVPSRLGGLISGWRLAETTQGEVHDLDTQLTWRNMWNPRAYLRLFISPNPYDVARSLDPHLAKDQARWNRLNPLSHFRSWLWHKEPINPRAILRNQFIDPPNADKSNPLVRALQHVLYEREPLHYLGIQWRTKDGKTPRTKKDGHGDQSTQIDNPVHGYRVSPLRLAKNQWIKLRNGITLKLFGRTEQLSFLMGFWASWLMWDEIIEGYEVAEETIDEYKVRRYAENNKDHYDDLILNDVRYDLIRELLATSKLHLRGRTSNLLAGLLAEDPKAHEARYQAANLELRLKKYYAYIEGMNHLDLAQYEDLLLYDPDFGDLLFGDVKNWLTYGIPKKIKGYHIPAAIAEDMLYVQPFKTKLVSNRVRALRKLQIVDQWVNSPTEFEKLVAQEDPIALEMQADPQLNVLRAWSNKYIEQGKMDKPLQIRLLHQYIDGQATQQRAELIGITRLAEPFLDRHGRLHGAPGEVASLDHLARKLASRLRRLIDPLPPSE